MSAIQVVDSWTSIEVQQLRQALRASIPGFASYLGVAPRTVIKWERGSRPQTSSSAILDTALRQADPEVRRRFWVGLVAARRPGRCDACGAQLDPEVAVILSSEVALRALARREIGTVFRLLQRNGVSQRRIAALTGQSQSEVSEIIKGRRVLSYDVLVRIADGLGVPRARMGLAGDLDGGTQ